MKWFIFILIVIIALKKCESGKIENVNPVNQGPPQGSQEPKGACDCGVFEKRDIETDDKALIQQTPMNVTCNPEGNEVCQRMCKAVAEVARAKGPTILCASVLNVNDLKVSVFSRSCFDKSWIYVNLTSTEPICCQNGEPINCLETPEN